MGEEQDHELLVRLDERTKAMAEKIDAMAENENRFVTRMEMAEKIGALVDNESRLVTRIEFEPVKKVVYGMVTLVLTAVLGALVVKL